MYDGQTIGVVVPAHNEAGHVGTVIETMPAYVDRIYAVDDASTDGTWDEMRASARRVNAGTAAARGASNGDAEREPRVVTVRHERNRGAGAAVKTGYACALEDGMDVTAVMDGDGQMDPSRLDRILEPVTSGDATYSKGNRLASREDYESMSAWRLFGNVSLTLLTRISSGYWRLSDPQNGFTAISNAGLRTIGFERLYDRYGFLNHVLFALNVNREPIADVSHPAVYGDETSGINYWTFVPRVSFLLGRSFLERLARSYVVRRFHPLVICYLLGVTVALTGVAGGLYALSSPAVDSFLGGMVSVAVGALGGLLLVLGLWFDVSENEGLVRKVSYSRRHEIEHVDDVPDVSSGFEVYQDGGTTAASRDGDSE
ncbi:glycosyltransferase family 2 protein [Halobellus limi]|uniref:Glycosyltransferase family 2 protein n=1 Tax=Halobellus limi TaxID=699433 RepID=A0A1H6BC64_9EURY|nr:glycosyltransferase family 2 protein [Halobellus limi]QCC49276.1 glycosyltransferase family 2 protein [Halobellus limi]SEG58433.1 Glycosyltransferase involved in cell wall bisynthesis [Halobellus limi]